MKWFIRGLLVIALYVFVVNYFEWSPKARQEAEDYLAVRKAGLLLGQVARKSSLRDKWIPVILEEIPEFEKKLNDKSFVIVDSRTITRDGYRLEYRPSVLQGQVVGFRVVVIDLDFNEIEVYVWYPGMEEGG